MNIIFLVSVVCTTVAVPAQISMYRCFFLDYSLGPALVMTASGVFFTVGTGGLVAPYFEINDFKLLGSLDGIVDSLNVNKEAGCMHLIVSEAMLLLVMLCWFMVPSAKMHKA